MNHVFQPKGKKQLLFVPMNGQLSGVAAARNVLCFVRKEQMTTRQSNLKSQQPFHVGRKLIIQIMILAFFFFFF